MKIKTFLNTSREEVESKKFNILIGISIGNKYFTKENIKDFLVWALNNTKERVAVLIPDKIHVINYEVKSGYSKAKAERTVFREAEKINNIIKEILNEFPLQKRSLIQVLKWEDIETENYKFMVKILYQEFNKNDKFRNIIIDIVKENIKSLNLTDSDYEKLAEYVLNELPMLISGVEYKGILYELLPYPGISKIDYLAIDLQEGKTFEKINKKLKIKNKLRIIEAYAK